jgi:hypothetical protein
MSVMVSCGNFSCSIGTYDETWKVKEGSELLYRSISILSRGRTGLELWLWLMQWLVIM